jgi:hypothetical protein
VAVGSKCQKLPVLWIYRIKKLDIFVLDVVGLAAGPEATVDKGKVVAFTPTCLVDFVVAALVTPLADIPIILPIEGKPPIAFMRRVLFDPPFRAEMIDILVRSGVTTLRVPTLAVPEQRQRGTKPTP